MARFVCYFLLLLGSVLGVSNGSVTVGVILQSPVNVTAPPDGNNATFTCNTLGSKAYWKINNTTTRYQQLQQPYESMGFVFAEQQDNDYYNLTLTVPARQEFNSTMILCTVFGGNNVKYYSEIAMLTIIIADVPLPPQPIAQFVGNSITLSWDQSFTMADYPVLSYSLRLENITSGEVFLLQDYPKLPQNTTHLIYNFNTDLLVGPCSVIHASITATNAVGESQAGSIYSATPTAIGPFAVGAINASSLFLADGTSQFLHISIKLPAVCYYQEMNYTIVLQPDNNSGAITLTKTVQEGRVSSCPPVPGQALLQAFEVSEIVPAALGVSYTVHVRAGTIAGSSTADPVYISTAVDPPKPSKGKTDHAVYAILGVYSVTVSVLLCVSAVLLCVCHKKSRRFTVNEVGKAQRSMVNNPIYESQTTGPVYECIPLGSSNQQTNCDSPSAISVRYLEQPQKASPVTSSSPSTSTSDDDKSSMLAAESPESMKQQDETALSCGMQVRENFQLRLSRGDTKIRVNGTINLEPLQEPMSPVEDSQSPQTMKGATTTTTTVLTMQGSTSRRDTAPVMIPTTTRRVTADANYTIMSPAGTISHSALSAGWGDHSPVDSNKYAFAD